MRAYIDVFKRPQKIGLWRCLIWEALYFNKEHVFDDYEDRRAWLRSLCKQYSVLILIELFTEYNNEDLAPYSDK